MQELALFLTHSRGAAKVPIPAIQNSVLKYFETFDLAAVARTRDGRLVSTRDPSGLECAWWGKATEIGPVIKRANANSGDVVKAAVKLGVRLVEHTAALQRTEELVRRLDARMHTAQAGGDLSAFNRAYRQYRLSRTAAGQPAMSFAIARSRLRQALADVAGGKAAPGIIARLFEDRLPGPQ
jgi:hypothetical protein